LKILVTGAAGFIGFHTSKQLLERGDVVVGLDNFNDYYDVRLKEARAAILGNYDDFAMTRIDLADRGAMESLFAKEKFDKVIHLAAQAGVRYSIENPHSYIESNVVGTLHILEGCRHHDVEHLTYASSSSVYGANTAMPFSIHQNVDHPLALYGATKKANELMAHTYSNLYKLPTTGLRFFTVYGPFGRPDMALFMFTRNILEQLRQSQARLHLHRRHRRGCHSHVRPYGNAERELGSSEPGSRHEPSAVSPVQYWQSAAGRAHGLHRRDRGLPRQEG
jgi:UDP-glucuronate 4-epimerase